MPLALTLPLVGLLIGLPGIPGFNKLPRLRHEKAAVDTLPPAWKPHPLLALENQFVFAYLTPIGGRGVRLKVTSDPRRLDVTVDSDSGTVTTVAEMGEVALGDGTRVPFEQFHRQLAWQNFQRVWGDRSRASVNSAVGAGEAGAQRTGGLQFNLPVHLPNIYHSFLGPGGPAINVSGSENIKLSGTSQWSNQQTGLVGQRRSLFPALDMQQDLNIQLEGQLSDRVKVNLLQNSAVQIPLANKIAINYRGGEDDLVQSLDLGNTNLTLPGTQYVSYSGRNEGLFGMKATTRLGPLDFTMLASKQEGKSERASYSGGSASQTDHLSDWDYQKGIYFLFYDPNEPSQDIDNRSIELYLDDVSGLTNVPKVPGFAYVDPSQAPSGASVKGLFRLLLQGAENDYEIISNAYNPLYKVIRLKRGMSGDQQLLAVRYTYHHVDAQGHDVGPLISVGGDTVDTDGVTPAKLLKALRAPRELLPATSDGHFDDTAPFAPTRELELHNYYQLQGQKIDPKTFKITIHKGTDDPPITFVPGEGGTPIPYFEILGLDNYDETGGAPVPGHDGQVDGTGYTNSNRLFVDYENGTLFFLDPRPFAPRIDTTNTSYPAKPFDRAISALLLRRTTLTGPAGSLNEPNRDIYDLQKPIRQLTSRYFLDVTYTSASASNEINLGRSNIIEGSEAVVVNGRRLDRDVGYTIDYDLGRVVLKASPGPNDQVSVDYSYAPLFQQTSRTLLGSAFHLAGTNKNLGGAFMYESKGAQDLRPRLGEEPSRVVIGDVNGEWHMHPEFMTRWVDALPGVRTTAPSELNMAAEVGMSFPNPNTFNEVFIDDMEGVRDAVTLAMTADHWTWSSTPRRMVGLSPTSIDDFQKNAEVHWFVPLNAVKERELKPNLSDAQGAMNSRQVLAISVPQRPPATSFPFAAPGDSLWVGLTYLLDGVGVDLSRSQFIEVWVNDFYDQIKSPHIPGQSLKLHLDLGTVSEDQRRTPRFPANGKFDTEDLVPRDQKLQVTGGTNEDTGIDGVSDESGLEVRDSSLITSTDTDPAGDDYADPLVADTRDPIHNLEPQRWLRTNGTEKNKNLVPIPDTEDLNRNDVPEYNESYFEYTIDLASSPADSAYAPGRKYFNEPGGPGIPPDNGWRRYRIPISDTLRVQFGSPDLTLARHLRVWVEGITNTDDVVGGRPPGSPNPTEKRPLLVLGGIEIVGSRWLAADRTPAQIVAGTTVTLNSVNNIDNADIYFPLPFDPGSTRNGSQDLTRREQSLDLEFQNLQNGDSLEVFRTFSLDEDYTRYGTLQFYVAAFDVKPPTAGPSDSLFYFLRFASDERGENYYEYRAPMPPSSAPRAIAWSNVRIKLTELSNLKLAYPKSDSIVVPGSEPGVTLIVKGRPSFTRLRRISTGVLNLSSIGYYPSGSLWLDEIRATDVARDNGRAERFGVAGKLSNLLSYIVNYDSRDQDFMQVGESRGSGNRNSTWNASTNIDLHRFFAGTGIVLPITYSLSGNRSQPRYTAGDDVVRSGSFAAVSESRADTRSWSAAYSRTWSERSSPFLRYTLGGISANMNRTTSQISTPSVTDTSSARAAAVSWTINPRKLLPLRMPFSKARVYPLPERFYWNYAVATRQDRTYDRVYDTTSTGTPVLRNSTAGRIASIDFGADSRPIDLIQHQFTARRNLTLPNPLMERIGFINLGKVVQWNQSISSRYSPNRGTWIRPQLSWTSAYFQNNGPELSPDLSVRQINNGDNFNAGWTLPFDQLAPTQRVARRDTLHRRPAIWRSLLSRLGAVSVDGGYTRASAYSRLTGSSSIPYVIGITSDPGLSPDSTGRVQVAFGNITTVSKNWRAGARTRLLLPSGAGVQASGDISQTSTLTNNVINRSQRVGFPSLDMDFGRLPELLGLKHVFTNPKLRSVYSRNTSTDYANSDTPTSQSSSAEWRPLVGFTGDFRNGTRTELRVQHRGTESQFVQSGLSSTTLESNTDVDLSLTRSYTKGQKMTILGKESTVKANITLGLTGAYSRKKSETRQQGFDRPLNPTNDDRLNVNARGSYGFSNNVTGNAEIGFSQLRDLQTDIVSRSVRLELRAQFTF